MSLVLHDVALSYGDRPLFTHVHLDLHPGERVALLGPNGCGKTTLLRLANGTLTPSAGTVRRSGRVAYLPQLEDLPGSSILDAVRPSFLSQAGHALHLSQQALEDPTAAALDAFAAAEEAWRDLGGYDFDQRATEVLSALHLRPDGDPARLSGGQRRRALLARLLLTPADTYLLDEPTNHLDWPSLEWLEDWVQRSPAAFLIVSHDRAFLDATVTRCAELERGQLRVYPGHYSAAMAVKATLRAARDRQYQAHQRQVAALTDEQRRVAQQAASTDRYNHRRKKPGHKGSAKMRAQDVARTLARRAQALARRLDRMDAPERLLPDRNLVRVAFGTIPHGPNDLLSVHGGRLEVAGQPLLAELNLHVRRGEKIAVIGPNGAGKSTLLRALTGQSPLAGGVIRRADLTLQWAGQQHEEYAGFQTLEDALLAADPHLSPQAMYAALARLGLPRELHRPLTDLSGGQLTRLALARLSLTAAPLLVLDEPTNHLDAAAIEAVQAVLDAFTGTVIFASHDRELVRRVATRHWWVEGGSVTDLERDGTAVSWEGAQ